MGFCASIQTAGGNVKRRIHKPLAWISKNCVFPVTAGAELAGKPVGPHLLPFQKKIIKEVLNKDGSIRGNVYIYGCRKVSKSFLFSMIIWYLFNQKSRKGFRMPVMASVFYQAKLLYEQMLSQKYKRNEVRFFMEKIKNYKTGAQVEFFANTPGSVLGQESDGVCADEIGAYKHPDTLLNLTTGGSLAPDKFLKLYAQNPPLSDDHFSLDLLKSCDNDKSFKVHRFYLPAKKDWTNEKNWAIASPFLKEYFNSKGKRFAYVMRFYRDYFNRALTSKTEENSFRRYLLGQYCGADTEFIPNENIKVSSREVFKDKNIRWAVGADYSVTHDFTSVALVGWNQYENKIYTKCFLYLPNTNRRRDTQKRMFQEWERAGYLTIQKAEVLEGQEVADDVISFLVERGITPEAVVFDKALSHHHIEDFKKYKVSLVRMNAREMTGSIRELERVGADSGLYLLGENKCLRWMFQNVMVSQKSKNYCLMNRISDRQNIDGPVSVCLAMKHLLDNPKKNFLIMSG